MMNSEYYPLKAYRRNGSIDIEMFLTMAIAMCKQIHDLHLKEHKCHHLSNDTLRINQNAQVKIFFKKNSLSGHDLKYCAPEQLIENSKYVNEITDIYVLGIIFYEALSGTLPFDEGDLFKFSYSLKTQKVPFLEDENSNIPFVLSSIIEKMTAISSSKRYQNILSVSIDLTKALHLLQSNGVIDKFRIDTFGTIVDLHRSTVLYGREQEVSKLQYIIDSKRNKENQVILLYGDSGIGKSVLVKTVIEKNRMVFPDVLSFKLDVGEQTTPYQTLYHALRDKTKQLLGQDEKTLQRYKNKLLNILGTQAQTLVNVIPEIETILGKQPEDNLTTSKSTLEYLLVQYAKLFMEHNTPLCIYIDDIQWADKVTIDWVKNIILNLDNIVFFMTYRDEESAVARSPVFGSMLFELSSYNIKIEELDIVSLSKDAIGKMIHNTMGLVEYKEVSQSIYERTKGNPFFVKEYLKQLHKETILWFDMKELKWKCDIRKIDSLQISDNVFDMLSNTIDSLDLKVQKLLCIASCMGNVFSHDLLEKVFDDHAQFDTTLSLAVSSGWIVEDNIDNEEGRYRFLHDKMQKTIHTFLLGKTALKVHYKIGCHLQKKRVDEDRQTLLICVNHLNIGSLYVKDKKFLGELNMDASIYAKESGDFESALRYIKKSMELSFLNTSVENTVNMLKLRAECEHLCNQSEEAIVYYDKALELSVNVLQKAKIYELLIKLYSDISEFTKAYEISQIALKNFAVTIPKKFLLPIFIVDFLRLKFKLRRYSSEDLIHLPSSEDEDFKMIIRLLANTLQSAYQIQPELSVANALIMVRLCLENGLTKESVIGFTVFGVIFQGAILGNHTLGYDYSKFSFQMLKKFDNTTQHAEVQFVCGYFATSWRLPALQTEENWSKAYKNGLEIGDWFHTGCAAAGIVQSMFMRGVTFDEILQKIKYFENIVVSIGASEQYGAILSVKQAVINLSGQTLEHGSFDTDNFNETEYVNTLNTYQSGHFAHYYFINKMITLYVHQRYAEALAISKEGEKFAKSSKGMLHHTEYMFYDAIIKAKLHQTANVGLKLRYKRVIEKSRKKFRTWADKCSENFLVRADILEAEGYRIGKRYKEAFIYYEKAIEGSKIYGQTHLLAIANRLMAQLYEHLEQDRTAKMYHREAFYHFNKWGINHILDVVDEEKLSFDIHTLIRASEVIAREHEFSSLLSILIRIIVENSGAQHGVLLLEKDGDFMIQASADELTKSTAVMQNIPYASHKEMVHPVVNYVLRSKEAIVIDDMTQSNIFDTSYASSRVVRSVLCAPLMLQGVLKGIIYLENNVLSGVFTANKVQLIQHLSGQIIISIENTLMYNDLEEKIKQRTKDLEETKDELKVLASTDPLTKLYNRRYFSEVSVNIFNLMKRKRSNLSLMMLDIDNFKSVNDTYGHQVGDGVIIVIANILLKYTRKSDVVCRFGGEEFIILLPDTDEKNAILLAEKLRISVENEKINFSEEKELKITVSVGVAGVDMYSDTNMEAIIQKADDALYLVKTSGKNAVLYYS